MLDTLISSKTRIKLLTRLFLNPGSSAYLRGLAEDFGESTNAVRLELNRFEEAGMLLSEAQGNKKIYKANKKHPLFKDIHSIVLKYVGLDTLIQTMIRRLGALEALYLCGDYAAGKDSGIIDLIFVGEVNKNYLGTLIGKSETLIGKKIRYIHYTGYDWEHQRHNPGDKLLLWKTSIPSNT